MTKQQVPVLLPALLARIKRALSRQNEKLKKTRGDRAIPNFGDYYVVDLHSSRIVATDVDPEKLGRELDVLKQWEKVVS